MPDLLPQPSPDPAPGSARRQHRADGGAGGARLLAVTGARGGLGASTLLLHLAWALGRRGCRTAAVDLDPAGGLGLLLGDDVLPGLRWADLPTQETAFRAARLVGALPVWHTVSVLTGDARGGPATGEDGRLPGCVHAVLTAVAREHEVVLVDLPRGMPVPVCAQVLLLTGRDLSSAVAAEVLVPRLRASALGQGEDTISSGCQDAAHKGAGETDPVRLVVRGSGEDVTAADLERITGCRVLGSVPRDRAVVQRAARGEDPVRSRSAMRRAASVLARRLVPGAGTAPVSAQQESVVGREGSGWQ
ncbi:hypothetical protein D4740_03365 [Actinomyces sp. 2119]|uniref:Uncharacterized protein n=1 Tax=Actinomyces lilanjuaniae TaxID=2321394 RepID=A0ABM6Z5E9_9ACTO|nr:MULTISPECIES: cellulose synthase operon protein YhjQ/BcsQ [Actinomyces]AYD90560.1 hypothetical protein D5R93_12135 [Actinomyces lilanjuaniae]RJF43988.1 hypothetical protein D4740_03365 [Actinomyces sp. 2119]